MEYTITDKGFGNEVRAVKAFAGGGGGFKSKAWSPEQVSEQNAVKVLCSALEGGKLELKDYKAFYTDCYLFMLNEGKTPKEVEPTHLEKAAAVVSNGLPKPPSEDLPF